jgi:asparagine N-glycosylation enzyme membrane subunit Stt3
VLLLLLLLLLELVVVVVVVVVVRTGVPASGWISFQLQRCNVLGQAMSQQALQEAAAEALLAGRTMLRHHLLLLLGALGPAAGGRAAGKAGSENSRFAAGLGQQLP